MKNVVQQTGRNLVMLVPISINSSIYWQYAMHKILKRNFIMERHLSISGYSILPWKFLTWIKKNLRSNQQKASTKENTMRHILFLDFTIGVVGANQWPVCVCVSKQKHYYKTRRIKKTFQGKTSLHNINITHV